MSLVECRPHIPQLESHRFWKFTVYFDNHNVYFFIGRNLSDVDRVHWVQCSPEIPVENQLFWKFNVCVFFSVGDQVL